MAMGDDAPSQGISFTIGLIVMLVLVSLGLGVFVTSRVMLSKGEKKLDNMNASLSESDYTEYENQTVKGSKVQTIVKQYATYDVSIKVVTGAVSSGTVYNYKLGSNNQLGSAVSDNTTLISGVTDVSATNYINPNANFKCTLVRDSNDAVTQMVFTQN